MNYFGSLSFGSLLWGGGGGGLLNSGDEALPDKLGTVFWTFLHVQEISIVYVISEVYLVYQHVHAYMRYQPTHRI